MKSVLKQMGYPMYMNRTPGSVCFVAKPCSIQANKEKLMIDAVWIHGKPILISTIESKLRKLHTKDKEIAQLREQLAEAGKIILKRNDRIDGLIRANAKNFDAAIENIERWHKCKAENKSLVEALRILRVTHEDNSYGKCARCMDWIEDEMAKWPCPDSVILDEALKQCEGDGERGVRGMARRSALSKGIDKLIWQWLEEMEGVDCDAEHVEMLSDRCKHTFMQWRYDVGIARKKLAPHPRDEALKDKEVGGENE